MKRSFFMVLAIGAIATACSDDDSYMSGPASPGGLQQAAADPEAAAMQGLLDATNANLAAAGADYRLASIEWIDDNGEGLNTVFFKGLGNKQLGHHFVPGDPRRGGRTNITYLVDQSQGNADALTTVQTEAAIDRAMTTWENVLCSNIPIVKVADNGSDPDVVDAAVDGSGAKLQFHDITHGGWVPANTLYPAGVLAATHTFVFVVSVVPLVFSDIDNNGKLDVAFREIFYNDLFVWQINASIDVETVALHESGHGLSQAHFGQAFITSGNDPFVHFAPRAVMNAAYSGIQQAIAESDLGGHCSIWAQWPNN
jgi:hypothetical protein